MNIQEGERNKYAELWTDVPEYRLFSPGMENVSRFMSVMHPDPRSSLIDIGCGTGIAGLEFQKLGLDVRWVDITDAGISDEIPRDRFEQAPLWSNWGHSWPLWHNQYDYGFCCDVMEHIPTEYTMLVFDRIISLCRASWFQISLVPDEFGAVIGQPLHLTVKPYKWWLERLREIGNVVDARDLAGNALYVVERR